MAIVERSNVWVVSHNAEQAHLDTVVARTVPFRNYQQDDPWKDRASTFIIFSVLCFLSWLPLASEAQSAGALPSAEPTQDGYSGVCKDVQISDSAHAAHITGLAGIEAPICRYFDALNHSDIRAVLDLYTDDPVMLPFLQATVVGPAGVKENYESTFAQIHFQVHTTIQEIVQMSPQWAFVRDDSAGLITPRKTGKSAPSAFHELFLLRKGSDGKWRIARYSFSPTSPLPAY